VNPSSVRAGWKRAQPVKRIVGTLLRLPKLDVYLLFGTLASTTNPIC